MGVGRVDRRMDGTGEKGGDWRGGPARDQGGRRLGAGG